MARTMRTAPRRAPPPKKDLATRPRGWTPPSRKVGAVPMRPWRKNKITKPEIDKDGLLKIVIELKKAKGWKRNIQWKPVAEHYIRKTGNDATNDKAFQKKLRDAFRNYRYNSEKHLHDAYKHYENTKDTSQLKEVLSVDSVGKLDINVPIYIPGYTVLLHASEEGHAEVVAMLLAKQGVDVNQAADDGVTPLYIASQEGHSEVVSMLLAKQGVDVNQAADDGCTPLYIASQEGHSEVVSMLLAKQGVDVNQAMIDGSTPLYIASQEGHSEVVSMLLAKQGVDVNQARNDGDTPLYVAIDNGYSEVVSMLLTWRRFFGPSAERDYLRGVPARRKKGGHWRIDGRDIYLVDGRIRPAAFRAMDRVPTETFTLNAPDVTMFTDEIDAPVRCVPCMHPHEASSLHRWFNTPKNSNNPNQLHKGCPLCQKAPEYVEFMSKLQVERWNNMEKASSEYEQELKRLRPLMENSSSNAIYKQYTTAEKGIDKNKLVNRYTLKTTLKF